MADINVNGVRLYYQTAGQGEPVLFIHGLGGGVEDWENQFRSFSRHYQTIAYDIRGFSRSEKPDGEFTIPEFAQDAMSLLLGLKIPSAHVVGVSLGGMIALQMAISFSGLVKSLTVVNSLAHCIPRTFGEKLQFVQRRVIVRLLGMRAMGKVLSKRLFPEPGQERLRPGFVKRWAKNDPRAYLKALAAISQWSVEDRLDGIHCPVLVLASEFDYWPVDLKARYTAKIKNAELRVIPGSRHAMPLDAPEALDQALEAFLKRSGS